MQFESAAPRVHGSHRLLLLASAALVVAPARAPADPAPSLVYVFGQADFPASNGGSLAASGDFNGDGRPDLVALNYQGDSVAIQLGQPDGSFADGGVSYPVGVQPVAAAVADFNGDGNLDLVVVNQLCASDPCPPGTVSILLGNGDGSFGARVDYETAADPVSVVVGDFNGDRKPDLAVAAAVSRISSGAAGLVSILLGDGSGGFASHSDFPAGTGVIGVVAGDFNGQGIVDLVVDNHPSLSSHTVSLLRGAGDGSFAPPTQLTVSADPLSLATGDFNGDCKLDLAVATSAGISILLNGGNGGFQPPVDYAAGFGPYRLITADLNADGNLDLLVSVFSEILSNGSISVSLGNGDGTFQRHVDYRIGTVGQIAAGDFNGDAYLDVAVANGGSTVSIILGNGDGTLAHATEYATGEQPVRVASADFNGDRKLDLAVVNSAGTRPQGSVSILLGNGDGTFGPHVDFATGKNPAGLATGDFNRDDKPDVAVANADDDTVSILIGNGDGTLAPHVDFATGRVPSAVVARDFNADGLLDLAVSNSRDGTVSILLGNGDGSFQPRVDYPAGPGAAGMAADDFNGDGKLDLAVANANTPITFRDQGLVSILLGNGDGTFQKHLDTRTQSLKPLDVTTGDFNHDGRPDLAVVTRLDVFGSASILTGNGDGTFQIVHTYQVGRFSTEIAAGDFNRDGELDLAVANFGSNTMTLLKGRGDGTFQTQGRYGTANGPAGLVMDDFHGDNSLDAAVVNLGANTVSVFSRR